MDIAYVGSTVGHDGDERARRERISNDLVDAEVTHLSPSFGPQSVESGVEAAFGATAVLELVRGHRGEFDGFFVGCFGEPGLEAARELTDTPVVGSASASFHVAAQLADRVSCITILPAAIPLIRRRIEAAGLADTVVDVRSIDTPIHDIDHGDGTLIDTMVAAGDRAVDRANIEAIVPGCMTLSYMRANAEIADRVGVPVVDPVAVGLETTMLLAKHGLTQSQVAYPTPRKSIDDSMATPTTPR